MAKDNQPLPSIKVRTSEPYWRCRCPPENRCRVVVEIPPPQHPRVWWIIRRPAQSSTPPQVAGPSSGGGSTDSAATGEPAENAKATSETAPSAQSTQASREISLPPIETLPDAVDEDFDEESDGGSEWEPEEEVDELEGE
ncbi:unnamed protein product [Rhizoctonia solani]|uniref:Uncharacterized protein n=1 Tax=Rhizoctonia solani TaxID=456999 RepID=A0A8H2XVZ0_9AGAM|nr:unnamed protein product [Rhizoctonia solani]